jgi:hypothetical protein
MTSATWNGTLVTTTPGFEEEQALEDGNLTPTTIAPAAS